MKRKSFLLNFFIFIFAFIFGITIKRDGDSMIIHQGDSGQSKELEGMSVTEKINILSKRTEGQVSLKELGAELNGEKDETVLLQDAVKSYDNIIVNGDIKISSITITRNNQKIIFDGDVTVTGDGFALGTGSQNVSGIQLYFKNIIGSTSTDVVNGALSPVPTPNSAIVMKNCFFNRINFGKITGFNIGIVFPDGLSGTENKFFGSHIGLCKYGVKFENTHQMLHEGNYFLTSIFNCDIGIDIDPNCKYQNFQGVVDCAAITKGIDIYDRSGGNFFNLYFVRGQAEYLKIDKGSIVTIINGDKSSLLQIGSNSKKTVIGEGKLDLYTSNMDSASPINFYFTNTGMRLIPRKTEAGIEVLSFVSMNGSPVFDVRTDNQHIALPGTLNGNFGGNFVNLNMSAEVPNPIIGEKVLVHDKVSKTSREYTFIGEKWCFIELL
ncbi:hypothetical protein V7103_25070 [Neobacillus drentensis]|uniref:hypothetical protein n=1 Tax=Neobacillus drentensis TaxID=220684 RepID=UPI002FFDC1E2